jgi:copper(I)-binding protein
MRSGWASALPRRLVLIAAAALVPVLAGCEAGSNAPTQAFHYPTDTAGKLVGHDLSVLNVFVLGVSVGKHLDKGQNAALFLNLVNTGPADKLISITAPGSASSVSLPAGGVRIGSQRSVLTLSGPHPVAYLMDLTRPLRNGSEVTIVLHFLKQGPVDLVVPVMARATHFTTYRPPPSPSPSRSPHAKTAASPTPSPSS